MEEGLSRKRPFSDHGETEEHSPAQKRVRFPKGKRIKLPEESVDSGRCKNDDEWMTNPHLAAQERARRRSSMTTGICLEESDGIIQDIGAAEVDYEDNESFYDDGIQIEPFNLENEREQGYFDAEGNYVEYIDNSEVKDAWLDNVDVESRFSGKTSELRNINDDSNDLSSDEIGKMKRRIADILESGETVLAALKRLKGNSKNRKEKMPPETKRLFDQLTEDAMKLMDNGDYNVYHESQEVFEREAEGYEALNRARGDGTSTSGSGYADGSPNISLSTDTTQQALSATLNENLETLTGWNVQSDYVYEEVSGYYYSASLGYYYDPSSNLYCYAASGKWYSYNEETGLYIDAS